MDEQRVETGTAGSSAVPEVIVALDYADPEQAFALVDRLPEGTWYKVGLELFTRAGPPVVRRLVDDGRHVFLDLKLHDIPNTVAGAARAAAAMGVRLLTLHASGGEAMLRAAVDAVAGENKASGTETRLLAISVLTSLDDAALSSVMGEAASVEQTVGRLSGLARESGIDGVVWPCRTSDGSPRRQLRAPPAPTSWWSDVRSRGRTIPLLRSSGSGPR